jgi:hypothetical protein
MKKEKISLIEIQKVLDDIVEKNQGSSVELVISIDVSLGEEDSGSRAFATKFLGLQKNNIGNYSLLFEGFLNDRKSTRLKKSKTEEPCSEG